MLSLPEGREGVLPSQHLERAVAAGVIDAGNFKVPTSNIQPASLDLRLGEVAYRIRCSFLPGQQTVGHKVKELIIDELDLHREGAVLETNRPYLIPLKERLALPAGVRGKANPKSSTGRADVFTRVITDYSHRFDEIAAGYEGPLWLEVVPLSFAIRVREDLCLGQLRLSVGRTTLGDDELRAFHWDQPLLFKDDRPVAEHRLALAAGMFLSLDLRGAEGGRVGYRARDTARLLDMTLQRPVEQEPYWEPVIREEGDRIVLTPQKFYLLMSDEAVSIPPDLAAEMTAYDPTSGELRTHYAGFFDPGFGYDPQGELLGSRAALEVRAHDVPFMIDHRQRVCKLTFERMLEPPLTLYGQGIGSSYQRQEDTLGKHFVRAAANGAVRPLRRRERRKARLPPSPLPGPEGLAGERPQEGRYREFLQADFDVIGKGSSARTTTPSWWRCSPTSGCPCPSRRCGCRSTTARSPRACTARSGSPTSRRRCARSTSWTRSARRASGSCWSRWPARPTSRRSWPWSWRGSAPRTARSPSGSGPAASRIARALRARGIATEVAPEPVKYGRQIRHAERRGIPYVWFPEGASGSGEVHDIRTGVQAPAHPASWLPPEEDLGVAIVAGEPARDQDER